MISQNVFTLLPNGFAYFIVADVSEIRDNFAAEGVTVNLFNNLGSFLTFMAGALVTYALIAAVSWTARKIAPGKPMSYLDRTQEFFGIELFYSLIESNNQCIILAVLIAFNETTLIGQSTAAKAV